jgi:hypothetical protein
LEIPQRRKITSLANGAKNISSTAGANARLFLCYN